MSNKQVGPIAKTLMEAKKRIEDPENWCQGNYRSNDGRVCAAGALGTLDSWGVPANKYGASRALNASAIALYGMAYIDVNDDLGHAAILSVFDHAIERAIAEGK